MTSETLRDALVQAHSMVDYAFLCAAGDEDAQAECKRVLGVIQDALSSDSVDGDIGGDPVVKATTTDEDVERVARAIYDATHAGLSNCYTWDDAWEPHQEPRREQYYRDARAAISAMSSREAGLREALAKCREQFAFYVRKHEAKAREKDRLLLEPYRNVDANVSMAKAATNKAFVDMIDAALSKGGDRG